MRSITLASMARATTVLALGAWLVGGTPAPVTRAEGLFYQLPDDGAWARFDVRYTFRMSGQEQPGQQALTMSSVGAAREQSEECRWIEFRLEAREGDADRLWIRKLLIPTRYLKAGENPTLHVIRGWTRQDDGPIEPAVPVHGRWPAFLAGPLQDMKTLPPASVDTSLGRQMSEGVSGWIEFTEGKLHSKVTFETRLDPKAPFGVVATRMLFDVSGEDAPYTIDAYARLAEMGTGAQSALPRHH